MQKLFSALVVAVIAIATMILVIPTPVGAWDNLDKFNKKNPNPKCVFEPDGGTPTCPACYAFNFHRCECQHLSGCNVNKAQTVVFHS